MINYPKRLIEVDLPIKRISVHARREKSIRHGHISTLHIWWARRPLAACRAVLCASLWPDPADALCAESFREVAKDHLLEWLETNLGRIDEQSYKRFNDISREPNRLSDNHVLRLALLDFIAEFSNWDYCTHKSYLRCSNGITEAAHRLLSTAGSDSQLDID